MRVFGWCTGCRRFRDVNVTSQGMVTLVATKVAAGLCADCEDPSRTRKPPPARRDLKNPRVGWRNQ